MDGAIHSLSQRLQCQACNAQVFVEPATTHGAHHSCPIGGQSEENAVIADKLCQGAITVITDYSYYR